MKHLLDTHTLLWWLFDDPRLSSTARSAIADARHSILVSSASAWEITTKHRIGKLPEVEKLLKDLRGWLERATFQELPISIEHAELAGSWKVKHRDPFDRMLAAQSRIEGCSIITTDPAFGGFGIDVLW